MFGYPISILYTAFRAIHPRDHEPCQLVLPAHTTAVLPIYVITPWNTINLFDLTPFAKYGVTEHHTTECIQTLSYARLAHLRLR
jgi:hypothetical protein